MQARRAALRSFAILCAYVREMGASHDGSDSSADYLFTAAAVGRVGSRRRRPSLFCWYFGSTILLPICFTSHPLPPIPIVCSESCCPLLAVMPQTKQVKTKRGGN